MWPDGRTAPLRSKASNRCPGCARAVAYENMTLLRIDAEENGAPGHVLTLTSRDPVTDAGAYREACAVFWRAFRRTWGESVEYCGFIEWTTGDGPRSGGFRRMHSHWLLKGLSADDLEAVELWASQEWRKLTGAWVVQLAELRTVGGIVGYLALHHEKLSQAPPEGWSGKRFRPSKGYFGAPVAHLRQRARDWLCERRWREQGLDEGGMLSASQEPAPRVVWGRQEWELQTAAALAAMPYMPFDSLLKRRELDRRLLAGAQLRATEDELDRYARVWHESMTAAALRRRGERRARAVGTGSAATDADPGAGSGG